MAHTMRKVGLGIRLLRQLNAFGRIELNIRLLPIREELAKKRQLTGIKTTLPSIDGKVIEDRHERESVAYQKGAGQETP